MTEKKPSKRAIPKAEAPASQPTKRPAPRATAKQATPPAKPVVKPTVKRAAKRTIRRTQTIDIRVAVRAWLLADDAVANFSAQKDTHRLMILEHLEKEGEPDESGSQWLRFHDDPIEGRVKAIKRERRVRRQLDPEAAEEYLREKGLWEQCIETIVQLDETKLLALNWPDPTTGEPVISDEDMEALYDVAETWAFVPQRVKL